MVGTTPEVNPYTGRVRRLLWLRRAVGLVLLAAAGAVLALYFAHRRHPPGVAGAPLLGIHIQQSASGVTIAKDDNGRPVFRVHAARVDKLRAGGGPNAAAGSGDEVLHGVQIEVYDRDGRPSDSVTGDAFGYNEATYQLQARGEVQMTLQAANPVHVSARDLSYNVRSGLGTITAGLAFSYLNAAGHAAAAALDAHAGRMELRAVRLKWKRPGAADLDVQGDTATLERKSSGGDAVIQLAGGARATTGEQSLAANTLEFHFRADQTLREMDAAGAVLARDANPARPLQATAGRAVAAFAPAGPRRAALQHLQLLQGAALRQDLPGRTSTLTAQSLDFSFSPAHELQTLLAAGAARLQVGGGRPENLAAPALAFQFTPGAARAPRLAAVRSLGRATVQLASAGGDAAPVVASADQLQLQLDADQHPARGLASGNVELTQPIAGEIRNSQCDQLELRFAPASRGNASAPDNGAALEQAIETGHVRLRQGDRRLRGDRVVYDAATRAAEITAAAGSGFSHGLVQGEDPLTRFQARTLTWTSAPQGGGLLQARGEVRLSRTASAAAAAPTALGSNLPFVVTANALDWSQPPAAPANQAHTLGAARFRGSVRLLQSPNLLTADQLDLDQAAGTLRARGQVRTIFVAPPSAAGAATVRPQVAAGPAAVQIQADSLQFQEATGEASYRGAVVLETGNARLTAPELQVWLAPGARGAGRLERALAQGGVSLSQPGRTAASRQLLYDFAAGRVELRGGPPSILDAEHGQIHGDPLTFFLANDEIQVGSPKGARAEGQTVVH